MLPNRIGDGAVAGNIKGFVHGCVMPLALGAVIHPMIAILYVVVVGGLYLFYFGAEKLEAKLMFGVSVLVMGAYLAPVAIDMLLEVPHV